LASLKDLKFNKTPGYDGLPVEFYVVFFNDIIDMLFYHSVDMNTVFSLAKSVFRAKKDIFVLPVGFGDRVIRKSRITQHFYKYLSLRIIIIVNGINCA